MISRRVVLTVAIVSLSFMVPALASVSVGPRVGLLSGLMEVGKAGSCDPRGYGALSGGGLGLLPSQKTAWYVMKGVALFPLATFSFCGRLTAPVTSNGVGASCVGTKGWGGRGLMESSYGDMWASNFGWKASMGGTHYGTGDVGGIQGKKADLFLGAIQADPAAMVATCAVKHTSTTKSGRETFPIVGVYEVVPGIGGVMPKKAPKD